MRLLKRLVFVTAGLAMFLTLPVQQTEVHGRNGQVTRQACEAEIAARWRLSTAQRGKTP